MSGLKMRRSAKRLFEAKARGILGQMLFSAEIPPTAGLPACFRDFLAPFARNKRDAGTKQLFTSYLAEQFSLPPLQLECSGTASLIIALETLKSLPQNKARDEVVIPAYNCPLVALAIAHCGLKIRLCDTAPDRFEFDEQALSACVSDKTLAIIPVHLGGQTANISALVPLARRQGAFIIEDAAQSFGSPVIGKGHGIGAEGDIVFFSLAVGKGLTLYEGGLLTAKTAEMRGALRDMSRCYIPSRPLFEIKRIAELFGYACFYRPYGLPFVYGAPRRQALAKGDFEEAVGDMFSADIPLHRVSDFRAACGLRAAQRLPDFIKQTQKQAAARLPILRALAAETGGRLKIIGANQAAKAVWPFFMLLMPDEASRDRLMAKLWPLPYGASRLFIHALSDYDYLKPQLGAQNPVSNACDLAARMFTISNSLWLADSRFEKLCHIIKQAFMD